MLKPERKALLDSLVAAGVTVGDIHKKHGFNYKTVRRYYPDYRKHVGKKQNGKHNVSELLKKHADLIEEMAEERAPGYVIAKSIGIKASTLRNHRPELMWAREEVAAFGAMVRQMNRTTGWERKQE